MKRIMRAKVFQIAVLAIVACFVAASCKKSDSVDKNELASSNIAQYTFGEQDLVTSYKTLSIPTTKDTLDNSAWFVYLYYQPLERWYIIPGYGTGGATNYRLSIQFINDKANIYIDKVGPGEKYAKARVVRIYNRNKQVLGRLKEDHEAVMEMVIGGE